jgi:hypothetical protein
MVGIAHPTVLNLELIHPFYPLLFLDNLKAISSSSRTKNISVKLITIRTLAVAGIK